MQIVKYVVSEDWTVPLPVYPMQIRYRKSVMKKFFALFAAALPLLSATPTDTDRSKGAELFALKCSSCHTLRRPIRRSAMAAPPAMGIAHHVAMRYPERRAFVKFIVDYAMEPSADKALCEKETIERFGLMPSQKGAVRSEELKVIAEYLYDNFAGVKRYRRMRGGDGFMHGHGGGFGR